MNRNQHLIGIGLTVFLHVGFLTVVLSQDQCGWLAATGTASASSRFENARVIEAGLAMKKVEKKKGKLPTLSEGVETVPAGVVRIMELQAQGYAYIRP